MKKLIFIALLFVGFYSQAQINRFPSIDSAKNYVLRYVRNSTVESFTNLRMQNVTYGTLELLDSLFSAGGGGGVDSIWRSQSATKDTLKYSISGTTYTICILDRVDLKQGQLTLTTTGSSGAATLTGNTLNIPQYSGGGGGTTSRTDSIGYLPESSYSEKDANEQGYLWERVKNNPISQWYDGISTAVYKDTLIIFGGWNANVSFDSSWHSWDGGVTWSFRGLLPQRVHTPSVIHSNDGYTYIIGGDYLSTSDERAKIFKTKDFRNYELVNSNSPFRNRVLHAGVEFNDTLYVGGGQKYTLVIADSVYTDLWKSGDGGVTWTLVSNSLTHMGKNISGAFVVFDGRMYIVSGGKYDNNTSLKTFDRDVYSSVDGLNWINTGNIPFDGMQYPNVGVWDGKLWLAGGYIGSLAVNTDSTAFMDKSGVWHRYLPATRPSANHASSMIVYKDRLFRTLGNTTNEIWALKRYKDIVYENTPTVNSMNIDTLKDTNTGLHLFYSTNGQNVLNFKNSANTGAAFIKQTANNLEIFPNGTKKYEFNPSGTFYASKILASNGSTTFYDGASFSTTLQMSENYPGFAMSGISDRAVFGLDGSNLVLMQEFGSRTAYKFKYNINDGRLVINNTTANSSYVDFTASAAFEVRSTTNGLLLPRMTKTQRDAISSPVAGLMIYQTDNTPGLRVYNGTSWMRFTETAD